jgi:hypothetical protein
MEPRYRSVRKPECEKHHPTRAGQIGHAASILAEANVLISRRTDPVSGEPDYNAESPPRDAISWLRHALKPFPPVAFGYLVADLLQYHALEFGIRGLLNTNLFL